MEISLVDLLNSFQQKVDKGEEFKLMLKISPGAKKSEWVEVFNNSLFKVRVAAAPEKGKANIELINFLSKFFGIRKEVVQILRGHTSPLKIILIKPNS